MVVADIVHAEKQIAMTSELQQAFSFLRRPDLDSYLDGKVDIDGDRVFALVQRYTTITTERPRFEFHRKYLDIQYLVSGEEVIGWAPAGDMTVSEPYDANKDVCFGSVEQGMWTPVHLQTGRLAVLWPDDAHAPRLAAGKPVTVIKIVVKVQVG
ncbi:MAG TPA: YhcH/YjgK/YiaL family protein [Nitrospirota bacterium]|nr:YhcH/YjgK/YiaL family protein [Nitrospirota bacterium]